MIARALCLFACVLGLAACASVSSAPERRPLVMISIDGFRADYLQRGVTPTLARLADEGVRAAGMRPSLPALTYPNHYTLVTGLRPDRHGLVHNVIEDPAQPGVRFTLGDRAQVRSSIWWEQAEPIWITARRAGLTAYSLFWPSDEAEIHGLRPSRWMPFDMSMPSAARSERLLEWFVDDRPDFAALYFDEVDTMGHRYGPDSPELNRSIANVDAAIDRLLAGLAAQGLTEDRIDLIITADHGMARADRLVMLDEIAGGTARVVTGGATAMIEPLPGHTEAARAALVRRHDHMTCWDRESIPARFDFGTNPRVSSIVCLADVGWYLTTRTMSGGRVGSIGQHGFDPAAPEMAALFIAHGPSFRSGVVLPDMDNVDVYPAAMRVLGVPARPNDGDPAVADAMLRPPAAPR
jgi:ectonucleotide pyrophosphatase/phosphodiesterase family protein 5